MKMIIDIPDEVYKRMKDNKDYDYCALTYAIDNGIPLPKGHGELIDKDIVLDMMNHGILEEYITLMGGVIPADK